ncbi:MAG: hypothetical protein V3U17_00115 [Thermoplasmata archaeon]
MSRKMWMVVVTIVGGVIAFLISPAAPLGAALWPVSPDFTDPGPGALVNFLIQGIIASFAFGFGIAFLLLGWPPVKGALGPVGLAGGAYVSLAFLLLSPWVHDSLHQVLGESIGGIALLGYLFHLSIIPAALVLVYAVFRLSSRGAGASS